MRKSPKLLVNDIPLVEAAHQGSKQRPTAIVIRTSWTSSKKGAANAIAQAWHNPNNKLDSCHYVVDEARTIRCVPDKVIAWHTSTYYNKGAISINVCYDPPDIPPSAMIARAAYLTARLCKLYHIPVRVLDEEARIKWLRHKWRIRGGIIINTAGDFPTNEFFTSVESDHRSF